VSKLLKIKDIEFLNTRKETKIINTRLKKWYWILQFLPSNGFVVSMFKQMPFMLNVAPKK
jgi:hypothetical protein